MNALSVAVPAPLSISCVCGRIFCLSFGSKVKTSPYSGNFDELCFQWVLTEKFMRRGVGHGLSSRTHPTWSFLDHLRDSISVFSHTGKGL